MLETRVSKTIDRVHKLTAERDRLDERVRLLERQQAAEAGAPTEESREGLADRATLLAGLRRAVGALRGEAG